LSAELLLSQSRTDAATSLVAVYKALGAGWAVAEPGRGELGAAATAQR
jgi:outer membrane protein TolC